MALPAVLRAHGRAFATFVTSLALAVAFLVPAARVAAGPSIVVDTTADSVAVDGRCSLREAVLAANTRSNVDTCDGDHAGGMIVLPPGRYALTIQGRAEDAAATGDLDVTGSMTFRGAGAGRTTIDASGIDRAIDVRPGGALRLYRLTVTGGNTRPEEQWKSWEEGAGLRNAGTLALGTAIVTGNVAGGGGGGIFSSGALVIRSSTVSDSSGWEGAGGIAATGPTDVRDSRIVRNQSTGQAGSKPHRDDPSVAGGIDSRQPLTLIHSVVSHNSGGGEWAVGGVTMRGGTIRDSTISANVGGPCGSGGVVMIWGLLMRSTVAGNSAGDCDGTGGVVAIDSQIWNSTISGNFAGNRYSMGGSMQVAGVLSDVSTIVGSTITRNVNRGSSGDWTGPGGLLAVRLSPPAFPGNLAAIRDTIVAGNRDSTGAKSDCAGTVTSDGHNLLGSAAGCDYQARSSDRIGVNAQLGPLADNGGPTRTHLPMLGSPAIDAWDVDHVGADGDCPRQDQRGALRPLDGNADGRLACDIGAVEVSRP
jgi:CSLREA domain-containing protein